MNLFNQNVQHNEQKGATMTEIQIFNNTDFGEIRTLEENGQILFCGSDVAKALGYADTPKAIKTHCKEDGWVIRPVIDNIGRTQQAKFISEGNLYRLIVNSKLPTAEKFEGWVFDEVIPTIHKHGAYMTPETLEAAILNPDTIIKIATALKEEKEKNQYLLKRIEEDKPMVLFAKAVETSDSSILIGDLAKLIKQNGVDIGQKRLFDWMRKNGYLIKSGSSMNMPTQMAMELGVFEVKERTISNPDGSVRITRTTKVTGKGQQYFINKFLSKDNIA